jgi:hypothetical protein
MRAIPSLLLLLLAWPGVAAPPPIIKPDRTIRLVDGKDLGRFYTWTGASLIQLRCLANAGIAQRRLPKASSMNALQVQSRYYPCYLFSVD